MSSAQGDARRVLFVINPGRDDAKASAQELASLLHSAGLSLVTQSEVQIKNVERIECHSIGDCEIAIVLGGDGTMLRAADAVRGTKVALLGINLGHVGFLAEIERPSIAQIAKAIINKKYLVNKRMTLAYSVDRKNVRVSDGWALNEVSIERVGSVMVQLFVQVDKRPLSRWGCDGLIAATPTGSTAYAFSAGGPILWPDVEALVLLPIAAHALFSKPMVVSPSSQIVVDLESDHAQLLGDSLRTCTLQLGDRITITKGTDVVYLAHLNESVFSDRLVAKFKLPVEGWRGE